MDNIFLYWDGEEISEHYKRNLKKIELMHPDKKIRMLNSEHITPLIRYHFPELYELFIKIDIPAAKSDIARLVALYEYGGWYIDIDLVPLTHLDYFKKSSDIDVVLFLQIQKNNLATIPNSLIGGKSRHPFFEDCITYIHRLLKEKFYHYSVFKTTGPSAILGPAGKYLNSSRVSIEEIDSRFISVNGDNTKGSWQYQESCGIWHDSQNPVIFNDSPSIERLGGDGSLDYYTRLFDKYDQTKQENYLKLISKMGSYYCSEKNKTQQITNLILEKIGALNNDELEIIKNILPIIQKYDESCSTQLTSFIKRHE